jgi:hypothetical protein
VRTRNLTDTVTVLAETPGAATGGHNNPSRTWPTVATEPGLFQEQSSTENTDLRDTVVTRGVLFGIPGSAVTATSRVQLASYPGKTFRVVGDPQHLAALGGRADHTESQLELIT